MTYTTIERVRAICPHLEQMPDSTLQMFIDDASIEVEKIKSRATVTVTDQDAERLERWLAAHLATLQERRPVSQSVSGISVSFPNTGGSGLAATEYGQEYLRLRNSILPSVHFEVI
ncbi:MAG: DUF4054 domain-containing protein [Deltaproteobacteria bacterium]|nr:DUF4054 domain-containing protein [Deltaproteobacteria bacterium]